MTHAGPATRRPFDVVGVGANSVDYVNLLPAYPQQQGAFAKMRILEQTISCGGQMTTALATCVSLGLTAKYVGATGTDDNGRRIREELGRRGIDTSDAIIRDGRNQFAIILVDEATGERIVLWDRDEQLRLRERELPPEVVAAGRLVHVDDVDQEAAIRAARIGRQAGLPITSDLDRMTTRTAELVDEVTVPIFAEHLPGELTGEADHERALRKLRRPHHQLLVVTLGPQGAMALDGDRVVRASGVHVHTVDTTGAGDVFRGGFIYGLLQEWSTERVLQFANAAAAFSCTRLGALNGVPTLEEVTTVFRG